MKHLKEYIEQEPIFSDLNYNEAHQIYPGSGSNRQAAEEHVHAHVPILLERVGSGQQEEQAEEIPLGLDVGVGAEIDPHVPAQVAGDGIEGADQHHHQAQPRREATDPPVQPIDPSGGWE